MNALHPTVSIVVMGHHKLPWAWTKHQSSSFTERISYFISYVKINTGKIDKPLKME